MSFRSFHLHDVPHKISQIYFLFFACNCWLIDSEQRLRGNTSRLTSQWQKLQYVKKKKRKFVGLKGSSLVRFDELSHAVAVVVFFNTKKKADFFLVREKQTLISATNTSVDEGTETGITQLAPSGKQCFPRDTISAPFRCTLEFKLSSVCKMQST